MINMYKTIAVALSISLLGQNALFAQVQDPKHPPLAQVQAQAKQDRAWLQKYGTPALIGYGTLATAGIVTLALKNRAAHQAEQRARKEFGRIFAKNQDLLASNSRLQEAAVKDARLIVEKNKKIEGLKRSRDSQIFRRKQTETAARQLQEVYELRIATLNEALQEAHHLLDLSTAMDPIAEAQLKKYTSLFDHSTSAAERKALLASIKKEPWFQSFSKAEQQDFLKIINDTMRAASSPLSREGGLRIFADRSAKFFKQHVGPAGRYLRGFGRTLFQKGSLLSVGILLATISIPAITAQASGKTNPNLAKAIEENVGKFLNATPDELQQMEQYEDVYEACVTAAAVLHTLTQLDEEEYKEIEALLPASPAKKFYKHAHL